jgi:nucleoid DNA-binding protein
MKPTDFYRALSRENNYLPETLMKQFYDSLIRVIRKELHDNDSITLPNFGKIWLSDYKARRVMDVNIKQTIMVGPRKVIRFKPVDVLSKYFNFDE